MQQLSITDWLYFFLQLLHKDRPSVIKLCCGSVQSSCVHASLPINLLLQLQFPGHLFVYFLLLLGEAQYLRQCTACWRWQSKVIRFVFIRLFGEKFEHAASLPGAIADAQEIFILRRNGSAPDPFEHISKLLRITLPCSYARIRSIHLLIELANVTNCMHKKPCWNFRVLRKQSSPHVVIHAFSQPFCAQHLASCNEVSAVAQYDASHAILKGGSVRRQSSARFQHCQAITDLTQLPCQN